MSDTCKVVAIEHLSLDGVYQAPARADEDERGAFLYGGWSTATDDPEITQAAIGKYMSGGWRLLVGRTTYEDLYEGWQVRQPGHSMTQALANVQKLVATRMSDYEPAWKNSTVLQGDAADAVAALRAQAGAPLIMFGSGSLLRSLMARNVVDELVLMIHPLILGQGHRLLADTIYSKLQLVSSVAAGTGLVLATYRLVQQ